MFGVLLESRARRQRRTGGAALSVATHLAIVGAVTAFTVPLPVVKRTPTEIIHVALFKEPPHQVVQRPRQEAGVPRVGPFNRLIEIDIPTPRFSDIVQVAVPTPSFATEPMVSSGSPTGDPHSTLGKLDLVSEPGSDREWNGSEALMRVITQSKPRYPESLRQAAIDGHVLVQFQVDTLGRIDPASVTILRSSHDQFTRAVREALGGFRFRPAEVNGHRVIALAQMPFEFSIRR